MDSATVQPEYRCARCDINWPTKSHLLKHMILTHMSLQQNSQKAKFNYECPTCGKEFSCLLKFKQHLIAHQKRKFACSKCAKTFSDRGGLRRHYERKHGINVIHEPTNYKCDDCGGIFTGLHSFTRHAAIHKPPQFACNECDRKFFNWVGVFNHNKSAHLGEKLNVSLKICEVTCQHCPMKFPTATCMKVHSKNVHLPKEHNCPHCYREFSTVTQLNNHLLKAHSVHVKSDFKCKICLKQCKDQVGLATHSRFHGNPTYSCDQCDLMFYTTSLLSFHAKRMHTDRFPMPPKTNNRVVNYTCAVCCRPFALSKRGLRRHLQIHYFKPQACAVCQKTFNSGRMFSDHIRQDHPDSRTKFHCDFCNKKFPTLERHQIHMKYHQTPTMACPDCPLLFYNKLSLQSHSRTHNSTSRSHTGYSKCAKTVSCAICLRQFPVWWQLRDHLITAHNPTVFGCSKCDFQCYVRNGITRHLQHFHVQRR